MEKDTSQKNTSKKDKWIRKICRFAYEGDFIEAQQLINSGLSDGLRLTKEDATEIINSCGLVIRYSFIKPLADIGGIINPLQLKFAKEELSTMIKEKHFKDGGIMTDIRNDWIKGLKYAIKMSTRKIYKSKKNTSKKDNWLTKICRYAYEGRFIKAQQLINSGLSDGLQLTKDDATEIIICCGISVHYSFIKPLADIGGIINTTPLEFATQLPSMMITKKQYKDDGNISKYNFYKDWIKGLNFAIKMSKNNIYKSKKDKWLRKICGLAYEGQFIEAQQLINSGLSDGLQLTKDNATEIILSCGLALRYSFIKPLADIGGRIDPKLLEIVKEDFQLTMNDKKKQFNYGRKIYDMWNDRKKGLKLAIKMLTHEIYKH